MPGLRIASGLLLPLVWAGAAHAELGFNFPPPVSTVGKEIYEVHMVTMGIATALLALASAFAIYPPSPHPKTLGTRPTHHPAGPRLRLCHLLARSPS